MKDFIKLFKFLKPHLRLLVLSGICMLFSAVFDGVSLSMIMPLADKVLTNKKIVLPVALPASLQVYLDRLNEIPAMDVLKYMALGIIVLYILKGLFGFLQGYLMSDISARIVKDLRSKLFGKFHSLSLDFFVHRRGGELISRVTNDVNSIGHAISFGGTDLIYQSLQVVVFTCLIFFIHAKLALIALVLLPLISIPMVWVGKVLKRISRMSQEKMADINSLLYETILGARIVKAFGAEEHETKKFGRANYIHYKLMMKSFKRTLLLSPLTELLGIVAGVLVLFWGGKEVIAGRVSFGVLGVFLAALLSLIRPFKKLSQLNALFQQAVAASVRIYEILDSTPTVKEKKDALVVKDFRDKIVFEGVSFSYGHSEVLKDIELEIKRGEILAVVGPSGAGKTTMLDLIPRFYDPTAGRLLLDGKDIRGLNIRSLRQMIGIVTQETILFNDSVAGNIAYGMSDAKMQDIQEAAIKAHVHDVIERLPDKYDTYIGDRGVKLSGGERQRIAIARALLKNSPILILDEATSQLDTESERLVQEALNSLMFGRTVFVIAHRLSTIKHADRIIVLDKGKIAEQGCHDELIAKDGLYKRLYQNQDRRAESQP